MINLKGRPIMATEPDIKFGIYLTKCHFLEIMPTCNEITLPGHRNFGFMVSKQQKLFSEGVTKNCGPGMNTLQKRTSRNSYDDDGKKIHVLL